MGAADLKSAAAYDLDLVGGGGVSAAWSEQKSEQKTGQNPNKIVVQV